MVDQSTPLLLLPSCSPRPATTPPTRSPSAPASPSAPQSTGAGAEMQFLTASASVSSPVPPSAHLLRLSRPPTFPHLRRRFSPPNPLALTSRSPLLVARRPLLFTPRAHGDHGHHHHHHGHDHLNHHGHEHHHHHHGHGHGDHGMDVNGTGGGAVVMRLAKAIGWADVADALREHLQLCCISLGLLLIAAVCPHVTLLNSVKRLPDALIAVAFPLVGVRPTNSSPLTIASQ